MKIYPLFFALCIAFCWGACKKETPPPHNSCPNGVSATFKDLSGLDGCGYVLVLSNGTRLEVANLNELNITPSDGLRVKVNYTAANAASICMVGPIIHVDCIEVDPN